MPSGSCQSGRATRSLATQTSGSTESSVAGSCRGFTGGIRVCQQAFMATAARSTIAAGPQTGTYKAMWSELSRWILAQLAVAPLNQNCLGAIPGTPITASVMQDQEKRVIGMFSESQVMLTLILALARVFLCPGVKNRSSKSELRHLTLPIHRDSDSTIRVGKGSV
jgi:hypothetical protein